MWALTWQWPCTSVNVQDHIKDVLSIFINVISFPFSDVEITGRKLSVTNLESVEAKPLTERRSFQKHVMVSKMKLCFDSVGYVTRVDLTLCI